MKERRMPYQSLLDDPVMNAQIERFGRLELEAADDPFQRLISAIVGQQLSVHAARSIRERLEDLVEFKPTPLLAASEDALREAGLSKQKVAYVRSAAETFQRQQFSAATFREMSDEEVVNALTEIHGVGVWTAKMFLLFSLARPDIFPVEDLAIRRGMTELYGIEDQAKMVAHAERWQPHRSLASLYIWKAHGGG
jgi:DNA-3-methyladenine glycosylase II